MNKQVLAFVSGSWSKWLGQGRTKQINKRIFWDKKEVNVAGEYEWGALFPPLSALPRTAFSRRRVLVGDRQRLCSRLRRASCSSRAWTCLVHRRPTPCIAAPHRERNIVRYLQSFGRKRLWIRDHTPLRIVLSVTGGFGITIWLPARKEPCTREKVHYWQLYSTHLLEGCLENFYLARRTWAPTNIASNIKTYTRAQTGRWSNTGPEQRNAIRIEKQSQRKKIVILDLVHSCNNSRSRSSSGG